MNLNHGCQKEVTREQVLKARRLQRDNLLDKKKGESKASESKLVLNVTYHPAFKAIRNILNKIHVLLTPDTEHQNVFKTAPIIGFKRGKSLKDYLVRAKVREDQQEGESKKCEGKRCGVCEHIVETNCFQNRDRNETYKIKSEKINCNSVNVIYLVQCKRCNIQYVGSTSTKFRLRFNNYKACHKKFVQGQIVPQHSFHSHFNQPDHKGMDDWSFTLIETVNNVTYLRKREAFWQIKLNTFNHRNTKRRLSSDLYDLIYLL